VSSGSLKAGNSSFRFSGYLANSTSQDSAQVKTYTNIIYDGSGKTAVGKSAQSYAFSNSQRQFTFGTTNVIVPPDFIKWSVNISTTVPFSQGLSVSYLLDSLSTGYTFTADGAYQTFTTNNITYYLLALESSSPSSGTYSLDLEVLKEALVDNEKYEEITQELTFKNGAFTITLGFPAFNTSLFYDPQSGFVSIMPPNGSPSSPDLGLILGLALGIPGGILAVLALAAAATVIVLLVLKKRGDKSSTTTFHLQEEFL